MDKLEQEWVQLIMEARKIGLSIEDIQAFFYMSTQQNQEVTSCYIR
ncbi:anti-repressor SinI family protein [Cytobacillus praedii]|uniref:DNA-binding anti-repressor SinI n=1 Tax=Cytobacillus praedii TaxID=1742358 RepID=A0A4R1ASM7_9BACI|nr:anti-repressor SinI family protein [Cytobacillus praedii]TCJ02635.1 DNA-binding anti-repressor SinI [Cytobacillus praedii]